MAGTRAYVFHQNQHRCFYCGQRGKQLTLDHVIPKSRPGRVANLTAACTGKGRLPEEFKTAVLDPDPG